MVTKQGKKSDLNKADFLYSAINDVSGNIRFIDTKIALILAALGVVIGAVLTCRNNLYFVYSVWEECHTIFLWTLFIFATSVFLAILFSCFCLVPRSGKKDKELSKSYWYFNPRIDFDSFNDFNVKVSNFSDVKLEICKELYKLNTINQRKIFWSKRAIIAFSCMSFSTIGFFLIICYYYLFLS